MSRILRHVGYKDFQKTRQRQIGEQKELAAKKLKEDAKRKELEEAARPYKSNWRRENLREFGEWAPIETSGPTNSTSTTFGYFSGGSPVINGETGQQVTFTYSGLNGVENYPTSVTIDQGFGDTFDTAPPPFSQIGIQGYTAKLNPRYKEAQEKYEAELEEWERKKEQQQRDIEATFNKFGTSWEAVRSGGGIVKVGNSYVALMGTNSIDFGSNINNNVRVVRMVPYDPSKPMTLQKRVMVNGELMAWHVSNSQYSDDVYLQIGQPPEPPMEQEYLMPRRTYFTDVNPQLDASQEYARMVGADKFMNARVTDMKPAPKFTDQQPQSSQPKLSKLGVNATDSAILASNKSKLSDLELYKLGLHRGSDGKVYKLPTNTGKVEYDQMDPLNLAVNATLARLGLGGLSAFQRWANTGKNKRIPEEDAADWARLWADDQAQKGQSDVAYAAGQKPSIIGRPDRAVLGIDIPQSIQQGKLVRVPASKGGPGSAPTPLLRQIGGRIQKPAIDASGKTTRKAKEKEKKK